MKIACHAAMGARSRLVPFQYKVGPPGPREIATSFTHCGICQSDIHLIDDDWAIICGEGTAYAPFRNPDVRIEYQVEERSCRYLN